MHRRSFVYGLLGSSAAVIIGYYSCSRDETKKSGSLFMPHVLSTIMDENTIEEIGMAYLKTNANENSTDTLKDNILRSFDNNSLSSMETEATIQQFIDKKVHAEFKGDETIIVDGWVLSRTEVRQCALFSLLD